MQKLAAGNWKMNGTGATLAEIDALAAAIGRPEVEVLLCPPATLIARLAIRTDGTPIGVGGQDCHAEAEGAHTGDVAAHMLADAGASYVILGHSERRADHGEDDATIAAKVRAAWAADLGAIVCVGETAAERDAGDAQTVVGRQLAGSIPDSAGPATLVVAYEPVWAIGSGQSASTEDIRSMHGLIREALVERFGQDVGAAVRILYGGSVKAKNADEIFAIADVDGALVGGASLTASDFAPIVTSLAAS